MNDHKKDHGHNNGHGNSFANITINDTERSIHRGRQTVVEIKKVGEVPLNHELEQIIDGKFIPLADNGSIVIKGGEVFVSHIKDGGSA